MILIQNEFMYRNHYLSAIILMGGSGSRFKSELPKQFHRISGKRIYLHTLDAFISLNIFDEILLVTNPDYISLAEKEINHPKIKIA